MCTLLSHPKNPPTDALRCVLHLLGMGMELFSRIPGAGGDTTLSVPQILAGKNVTVVLASLWDAKPWFGVSQESTSTQADPA